MQIPLCPICPCYRGCADVPTGISIESLMTFYSLSVQQLWIRLYVAAVMVTIGKATVGILGTVVVDRPIKSQKRAKIDTGSGYSDLP